jgi:outer membrane protein TolC
MPGWPGSWKAGLVNSSSFVSAVTALALLATPALAAEGGSSEPLLLLEDALTLARGQNHTLAASALEVERQEERSAAVVTRRFPAIKFDAIGNRLLKSMDFPFNAGVFGTYPGIGAVPATDTLVSVPTGFSGTVSASIAQPIIQQYRIGLNLEATRLDQAVAQEDLRKDRQRVVAEVKSSYYKVSAIEAGVSALQDLVRAIEDVDKLTGRYLAEGRVLRSEALLVKARLARERHSLSSSESELATQHEHLNQLLGRDLRTPFRVTDASEVVASRAVLPLEDARQRAVQNRPEIRKVGLQIEQAENARRIANSGWIPDLTLLGTYARNFNYQVLPKEILTVGLWLSWEPWDWGRRGHEAHEQKVAADKARQGQLETQEQVEVEVGQRWRGVKDAAARLEAAHLSEEAGKAYLDDLRNKYREDATLLNDVLEAQARLSAARHDFTDALAGYWSATAELERTIGDENS